LTVFAHHSLVLLDLVWIDVNPGAWGYLNHFVPAAVALLLVRVVRIDLDRIDAAAGQGMSISFSAGLWNWAKWTTPLDSGGPEKHFRSSA
jgi:hypothetical protein